LEKILIVHKHILIPGIGTTMWRVIEINISVCYRRSSPI